MKAKVLTLSLVVHAKVRQAKLLHVVLESGALCPAVRLANESGDALEVLSRDGAGSSVSLVLTSVALSTHGMLWSTVTSVQSDLLTFRPAFRSPSNA